MSCRNDSAGVVSWIAIEAQTTVAPSLSVEPQAGWLRAYAITELYIAQLRVVGDAQGNTRGVDVGVDNA